MKKIAGVILQALEVCLNHDNNLKHICIKCFHHEQNIIDLSVLQKMALAMQLMSDKNIHLKNKTLHCRYCTSQFNYVRIKVIYNFNNDSDSFSDSEK